MTSKDLYNTISNLITYLKTQHPNYDHAHNTVYNMVALLLAHNIDHSITCLKLMNQEQVEYISASFSDLMAYKLDKEDSLKFLEYLNSLETTYPDGTFKHMIKSAKDSYRF